MHATDDIKKRTLHRLKIARGHLDKVIAMVEAGEYCIDVLHQSQAVQSALRETDNVMLENHLRNCVVEHINKGETDKTIDEVMKVFKRKGDK